MMKAQCHLSGGCPHSADGATGERAYAGPLWVLLEDLPAVC
jgi:hypothetical protein